MSLVNLFSNIYLISFGRSLNWLTPTRFWQFLQYLEEYIIFKTYIIWKRTWPPRQNHINKIHKKKIARDSIQIPGLGSKPGFRKPLEQLKGGCHMYLWGLLIQRAKSALEKAHFFDSVRWHLIEETRRTSTLPDHPEWTETIGDLFMLKEI